MKKEEMLSVIKKVNEVKILHDNKDLVYYNVKSLRRDILNVKGYIQSIVSSKWFGNKEVPIKGWNHIDNYIKSIDNLEKLSSKYSELVVFVNRIGDQIKKMRIP